MSIAKNESDKPNGIVEEVFETALFSSRLLVLIAVLGVLASAVVMFCKGTIEVIQGIRLFFTSSINFKPTSLDDNGVILSFIPAVDNYFFATILLIISMGMYELFISKIDPRSRKNKTRPNWLVIDDLDDMTSRIGEVVIMILIVNFFKLSFSATYNRPIDLLILGSGILLVSLSLVVAHYVSGAQRRRSEGLNNLTNKNIF